MNREREGPRSPGTPDAAATKQHVTESLAAAATWRCNVHGSSSSTQCRCSDYRATSSSGAGARSTFMGQLAANITFLDGRVHWWLADVRRREEATRNEAAE